MFDYLFKTIIVGDPGVGKTSITLRFATGIFRERYLPTIGVEFSVKDVKVDGKHIKLQLWDTGSHDRFSYIRPMYYRGSFGVLLVFDLTSRTSFEHLDKWFKEVYTNCEGRIPAIIVGNKIDIAEKREVSYDEVIKYVEEKKKEYQFKTLPYYEVSAKENKHINEIYHHLTKLMIEFSDKMS